MREFLVVGAGFAGSVVARELAEAGLTCRVIDRREHVAGNAYDLVDEHGLLVHRYGPHIFHTNASRIFSYLSRFTDWRPYEHRVRAYVDGELYPMPINRTTINRYFGLELDEEGISRFLDEVTEKGGAVRTSEDVVLGRVGRELCDKFFRGYTRKQWGLDLGDLGAGVAARIPVRTGTDDRYFTDTHQAMPKEGYTAMFRNLLDHPRITVELGTDFESLRKGVQAQHVIYTGPIDAYFDYCFGRLPYRSLEFEHIHYPELPQYQPVGTVNYPNDYDFTRITEFKHLTGQRHHGTSIVREYPTNEGDPYYPIPRPENERLYKRYQGLARKEPGVTFVGRLAQYRYYNMDQVVGAALKAAERLKGAFS